MTDQQHTSRNLMYSALFFGAVMAAVQAYANGWQLNSIGHVAAILATLVLAGGVFGLLLKLFTQSSIIPKVEDIDLMPGERVEHSGLANHFLNMEGRGGRLALTNSHLVFKPHVINLQRSGLRVALSDIQSIAPCKTLGIVPNGLAVTLKSGAVEKFVVNSRDVWLEKIQARIG